MAEHACKLASGITLNVRIDDLSEPWSDAPAVLLLHGTAETSAVFRLWTPWLARHFKVFAPDWRGMGGSDGVTAGDRLDMHDLVADARSLLDVLGIDSCYVAGEKLGALAALSLASAHPERVRGLALACGMISPAKVLGGWIPEWVRLIKEEGVRAWVQATQSGRMGDELEPSALVWWSTLMEQSAPASTLLVYLDLLARLEVSDETLRSVACPTLFLSPAFAQPGAGRFDQRSPRAEADVWRAQVRNREVTEISCSSYHLAATRPDECAQAARDFFLRLEKAARVAA